MNKSMKSLNQQGFVPILLAVLVLVMAVGGYFYFTLVNPNRSTNKTTLAPVEQAKVSVTDKGFMPEEIKVKVGTQVKWTNLDQSSHQIASDPHPSHTNLPGLESSALLTNDSYSFVFDKTGTFTYHDHLNPYKFKGTIIVK